MDIKAVHEMISVNVELFTLVYMNSCMERLRHKHRRTNVSFTCLTPLNIKSADRRQPLLWPSKCPEFNLTPNQYAKKALPVIGWSGRPSWFLRSLPRCSWVQNFFFYSYV
ncbi:hypothetical protein HELRODRAFT_180726 [Helobdella robusta]|uniref:Uncharacterized protein n=1 Tax=Helobdella robusta TaxID=6412 RepID=T1FG75_HELRO|nr:hypothetical protein HELRODRAFT_180726 [Helobdella robusta]ESN93634.1 hypothetical protein HELRODRAFT_180726 [Helobdella robusta]